MSSGPPWYDVTVAVTVWQNWTGFEGGGGVESNATYQTTDMCLKNRRGAGSDAAPHKTNGLFDRLGPSSLRE
jgi:hypothetical protein